MIELILKVNKRKKNFIFIIFLFSISSFWGQLNLNVQLKSEIESTCNQMIVTMAHDNMDRPFLYVANKEAGLKVYNVSNVNSPQLVATVATSNFADMEVINLFQKDEYVFLALGNIWNTDLTGMAIVNVQNPTAPFVTDYYYKSNSTHGSGIVTVEGNYAYLGGMQDGLIVLDVTDKQNIQFVSQFIPDINYPINNPNNVNIYNLRGMEVRNDTIYACYDAGGIRIIDVTNKQNPIEIGHYCNPVMYSPMDHPKAYNNIVLKDSLAFVAVDYCGVEILNISDPSNIKLRSWWNPYGCPNNNWFTSPVHANEIRYDKDCEVLFLSTGKSDMYALDVSDHLNPGVLYNYGGVGNNLGTWGVNIYQNQIYLSYICVPWPYIPFQSDSTLIKILTYNNCSNSMLENSEIESRIYPNPFEDFLTIEMKTKEEILFELYTINGVRVSNGKFISKYQFDTKNLSEGVYYLKLNNGKNHSLFKVIK